MYYELSEKDFINLVQDADINCSFTKEGIRAIYHYLCRKDQQNPLDFQIVTAEGILKYYTEYSVSFIEKVYNESIEEISEYKIVINISKSRVILRERRTL